jgi:hypothetical protein
MPQVQQGSLVKLRKHPASQLGVRAPPFECAFLDLINTAHREITLNVRGSRGGAQTKIAGVLRALSLRRPPIV